MVIAYAPLAKLLDTPVSSVLPDSRAIVTLHQKSTIRVALETFAANKILSAPVVAPSKTIENGIDWIALVSYHDLIRFFGSVIEKDQFLDKTVDEVVKFASSAPLTVESRSSLSDVTDFFGSMGRLHRCIVLFPSRSNKGPTKHSIVSQSDIVRYVAQHMYDTPELKKFGDVKICDLGWGAKKPVTVKVTDSLIDCVNVLLRKQVSCCAIVDASDRLVGNFSASDLRGIGPELPTLLKMPIVKVLDKYSPSALKPVSSAVTETLGVLINRMSQLGFHHIWLEDPSGKPEGLITLTDVMNVFNKYIPA